MQLQPKQPYISTQRPRSATGTSTTNYILNSTRPNSALAIKNDSLSFTNSRPFSANNILNSQVSRPSSMMSATNPTMKKQQSPSQPIERVPLNAHPQQIISAYERLLQKEQQKRGVTYDLDVVNAMANEIQCLRKERSKLQEELKLAKAQTGKREAESRSLRKELEQMAKRPQFTFDQEHRALDTVALKKKELQPTMEYVKALKTKLKELFSANQQYEEYIEQIRCSTRVQRMQELEKHFHIYYDRYNQLRVQNSELTSQIQDLQEENEYLRQRVGYMETQMNIDEPARANIHNGTYKAPLFRADTEKVSPQYSPQNVINDASRRTQQGSEDDHFDLSDDTFQQQSLRREQSDIKTGSPQYGETPRSVSQNTSQDNKPYQKKQNTQPQSYGGQVHPPATTQQENSKVQQYGQVLACAQPAPKQPRQNILAGSQKFQEQHFAREQNGTLPPKVQRQNHQNTDYFNLRQNDDASDGNGEIMANTDSVVLNNSMMLHPEQQESMKSITTMSQIPSSEVRLLHSQSDRPNNTNTLKKPLIAGQMSRLSVQQEDNDHFNLRQAPHTNSNTGPARNTKVAEDTADQNVSMQSFASVKIDDNMFDTSMASGKPVAVSPGQVKQDGQSANNNTSFLALLREASFQSVRVDENMFDASVHRSEHSFASVKVEDNMFD